MNETTSVTLPDDLLQAISDGDSDRALKAIKAVPAGDLTTAVSRMGVDARERLLSLLDPQDAARLLTIFDDSYSAGLIEHMARDDAAAVIAQFSSRESANVVAELKPECAEAILDAMAPDAAAEIRALAFFDPDVAGGMMGSEVLAYSHRETISDVVEDLRRNSDVYTDYQVQYIFVVEDGRRLIGVLNFRDLLLGRPETVLRQIMIPDPVVVDRFASLNEVKDLFDRYPFYGLPVVKDGELIGLVRRAAAEAAISQRAARQFRLVQGIVGGEEVRTMPLLRRSSRRLSWLSVNILLNVIAASVIVLYEDTLAQVIALAVFLPIISDMSGCSGNQAVAVSLRELSLGLVRPKEIRRVLSKEILVGVLNGMALGSLLGLVAWLWKGNPYLGLVVGFALMLKTVVAVSIGGTVPLALKRIGFDPALASGPILTTVTDMCGFFFALGSATVFLQFLIR
jgi:magnesium transporter